jgi:hypothetical protein
MQDRGDRVPEAVEHDPVPVQAELAPALCVPVVRPALDRQALETLASKA